MWYADTLEERLLLSAPTAENDYYFTQQDATLAASSPGVLANDSDPESDPLTAVLVVGPTSGSLTLNPDGSFQYVPNAGFKGTDSFTYRASDGGDSSPIATVILDVGDVAGDILSSARIANLEPNVESGFSGKIGDGIYGIEDVDFFQVFLNAGDSLSVDVDAQKLDDGTLWSSLDSLLRIFGSSGMEIVSNDDAQDPDSGLFTVDSALSFTAFESGQFYIGVSGYANTFYDPWMPEMGMNDSTGNYRLQLILQVNDPPEVSNLALVNDTGTAGDLVTTDPRITGSVTNDGSAVGLHVEYDYDDDGFADDYVASDAASSFAIDLTNSGLFPGMVSVQIRVGEDEDGDSMFSYGDWQTLTFTYELPSSAPPEVEGLHLVNDSGSPGDMMTNDAHLGGTLSNPETLAGLGLEFDYDSDGNPDSSTVAFEGPFSYDVGPEIGYGALTVAVRAFGWDNNVQDNIYGLWQQISFTYEPPPNDPPEVTQLNLINDTGTAGDLITSDPRVSGSISHPDGGVAFQSIEYDFNGDLIADGQMSTNGSGVFVVNLSYEELAPGSVTVSARSLEWDDDRMDYLYGGWVSLTFTYEEPINLLPEISNLALVEDTGDPTNNSTANPLVSGNIAHQDGGISMIPVEFDVDGDGFAEGNVFTSPNGSFLIDPGPYLETAGSVTIKFRAGEWGSSMGDHFYGNWIAFSFTYEGSGNILPDVGGLSLVNDTDVSGDLVTRDATILGTVSHADGEIDGLPVEFDLDGDGVAEGQIFTASGDNLGEFTLDLSDYFLDDVSVTVNVRAGEWDSRAGGYGDYIYGAWQSFSFVYEGGRARTGLAVAVFAERPR